MLCFHTREVDIFVSIRHMRVPLAAGPCDGKTARLLCWVSLSKHVIFLEMV